MSFDPSFLTNTRDLRREREDQKAEAWLRARAVRRCHRAGTVVLITALAGIGVPWLGVSAFAWWIAGGAAAILLVLAVVMFFHGGVSNGIVATVCALGVLPAWVHFSPQVVLAALELWETLFAHWRASLETP